jgi:predicted DNA-binding transcriptional regulator AlpA
VAGRSRRAYGLTEFAAISGLAPSTVGDRMDAGEIPELRRLGARRFIPADWVERWLSEIVNQPSEVHAS